MLSSDLSDQETLGTSYKVDNVKMLKRRKVAMSVDIADSSIFRLEIKFRVVTGTLQLYHVCFVWKFIGNL